jgi:hypothetical protein
VHARSQLHSCTAWTRKSCFYLAQIRAGCAAVAEQLQLGMALSCKRLLLLAACTRAAYLVGNLLLSVYIADYDTSASLLSESCDAAWPEAVAAAPQPRPWVVWDSVFSHRIAACSYEYEQFFAFFPGLSGGLLSGWLLLQRVQCSTFATAQYCPAPPSTGFDSNLATGYPIICRCLQDSHTCWCYTIWHLHA